MGRAGRFSVAAAMVVPVAALAQAVQPGTLSWHCEQLFDEQYHVQCAPRRAIDTDARAVRLPLAESPAIDHAGSRRELRPVALRGDAEVFAVPAWRVPLYALPIDAAFTAELLRAVLCGRVAACQIHYELPELRSARAGRASVAKARR